MQSMESIRRFMFHRMTILSLFFSSSFFAPILRSGVFPYPLLRLSFRWFVSLSSFIAANCAVDLPRRRRYWFTETRKMFLNLDTQTTENLFSIKFCLRSMRLSISLILCFPHRLNISWLLLCFRLCTPFLLTHHFCRSLHWLLYEARLKTWPQVPWWLRWTDCHTVAIAFALMYFVWNTPSTTTHVAPRTPRKSITHSSRCCCYLNLLIVVAFNVRCSAFTQTKSIQRLNGIEESANWIFRLKCQCSEREKKRDRKLNEIDEIRRVCVMKWEKRANKW